MARQVPPVCEHSFLRAFPPAVRASCVRLARGRARGRHELFSQWRRCSHKLSNCVSPGGAGQWALTFPLILTPRGHDQLEKTSGQIKGRVHDGMGSWDVSRTSVPFS